MTEPGNLSYPASSAGLLNDEESRLLALTDALDRANGPAICRAFGEVAHACGLSRIAAISGVSTEGLCAALADPDRPNVTLLSKVVEALRHTANEDIDTE